MKKFVYFAIMTLVSLSLFADDPYSYRGARKAIKGAYDLLKVYYPSPDDLCVSDTIYPKDWWRCLDFVTDDETKQAFEYDGYNIKNYEIPIANSKRISTLFKTDSCMCHHHKYVADFSVPFLRSIMCEIRPADRKAGTYSDRPFTVFFFRYDSNGEIIQMNKGTIDPHQK